MFAILTVRVVFNKKHKNSACCNANLGITQNPGGTAINVQAELTSFCGFIFGIYIYITLFVVNKLLVFCRTNSN